MKEIWKPIAGYENLYEVSSAGRVRRLETIVSEKSRYGKTRMVKHKARILKPCKTARGYLLVVLCGQGGQKSHMVHRLVASAFCQKPNGRDVVNHIDNIHTNNRAENLEWCTQKENVNHAIKLGVKPGRKASVNK
jgi:hypothetical protein